MPSVSRNRRCRRRWTITTRMRGRDSTRNLDAAPPSISATSATPATGRIPASRRSSRRRFTRFVSIRRIWARRSACRTDRDARVLRKDGSGHVRALCLRQRYGFDHERKLSGARHHARAGPDLRLHRRPAPCAGEGTSMKNVGRWIWRQYLLLHFRRQRRRYRREARGPGLWRGRADVLPRPSLAGRA